MTPIKEVAENIGGAVLNGSTRLCDDAQNAIEA